MCGKNVFLTGPAGTGKSYLLGYYINWFKENKENENNKIFITSTTGLSALLFKDGMTWKNRNKWHIDHIRPLASFKFINDDGSINQRALNKAWKITNLQPLWDKENMSKGKKWGSNSEEHFKLEPKDLPKDIPYRG